MDNQGLVEFLHHDRFDAFWNGLAEVLQRYFRVEVEGLEHIPSTGPAVIVPNHSGFAGTDVLILNHVLAKQAGRKPKILAHRAYFDFNELGGMVSKNFGLQLATVRTGVQVLRAEELLMIFPEGAGGNFKSSLKAYQLQAFKPGFLRMAIAGKAPVIPAIVIGAEESHLNLGSLNLDRFLPGYRIPLPLNLIPLPAKWKIRFLSPMDVSDFDPQLANDKKTLRKQVARVKSRMQRTLRSELKKRSFVFHSKVI